jgi:hypothetical protein
MGEKLDNSKQINDKTNLLLVGGTGRSGTSFVYRQLLKNKEVSGYQDFESKVFTSNFSLIDVYDRYIDSYSPERFAAVSAEFKRLALNNFSQMYVDRKIYSMIRRRSLSKTLDNYFTGLENDRVDGVDLEIAIESRSAKLFELMFEYNRKKSSVLLEKTPHNVLFFPQIKKVFPGAKIIHVVRDPRAIAESVVRQKWGAENYSDAVLWVRLILESWIKQYELGGYSSENFLCLRIEDLTTEYTEKENLIRQFVGEDFNELTLQASENALDNWRDNVSNKEFESANKNLSHIMKYFSYDQDILDSREISVNTSLDLG